MFTNVRKSVNWIIIALVIITLAAGMARLIETDFGKVEVSTIFISDEAGNTIAAKLYRPLTATAESKLPAVINIHGYQNDKLVDDSMAIELSRRGFVVVSPDILGHGDSKPGFDIGGLLTGKNTGGMQAIYLYVKGLPYVDAANIGVMGHSLGAILTNILGMINPEINALNPQCGQAGAPGMRNLLLTQARYDEFSIFREGLFTVDDLPTNPVRMEAFGMTTPVEWDTMYGSFADGTARKVALVNMEHHFLPLTHKAVYEAVSWMEGALKGGVGTLDANKQIFWWKNIFGLITLLGALFLLIPLTNVLLATKFFAPVAQPMPTRYVASKGNWWLFATINFLIGGITYPIFTQWSALSDKYEAIFPWLKLQVGNGVFAWLLVNAVICGILFWIWYKGAKKKQNVTLYDMGATFDEKKSILDWKIIGKTALMGGILFLALYLLEGFFQVMLGQEFRFVWPYMRQFANAERVGLFFLYMIPALLFWLINGGLFLFGQIRQKEAATPAKTQWLWWIKVCYAFLTGLLLVWLIQYIPWYLFNAGPGFELLGMPQFSALWPLMLQVYIPEFLILLWLHVWFYRRTGKIYLGAIVVASMMIWFLAAGSIVSI
jgi:pimeloyl-ACP methyl ester carboxylesterase